MALRYNAVGQAEDDTPHQPQDCSAFSPDSFASRLSATSESTRASMVSPTESPSPAGYAALNQQTFTPLSMNDSDYLFDHASMDILRRKSSSVVLEQDSLLSTWNTSRDNFLRVGEGIVRSNSVNSVSSISSAAAAGGRGQQTLVGTRVQSFEALHAAVVLKEQELLAKKSHGSLRAAALASPPATLSPSPGPADSQSELESESGSAPYLAPYLAPYGKQGNTDAANTSSGEGVGLGASVGADATGPTGGESLIAAQSDDNTVPPTAASTDPIPSAPISQKIETQNLPPAPGTPGTPVPISASVTAYTPIFRPTPASSIPSPDDTNPPLVRTSSTASIALSHPTPDTNKRSQSGAFLGNIAALEATAERLSMTSSIEAAIREEHNELKRTESRRSSVLQRARGASGGSDTGSLRQLSIASRKNSILGTTNAARFGGYLPGAYNNMNTHPHNSSSASARLRSGSKASSTGAPPSFADIAESVGFSPSAENGEDYPFMSRNGPGKASVRSVASKQRSLAEIAELENPTALTKDAMDAADRAAGDEDDEEQRIIASAHQQIDPEFAEELERMGTPQPVLDYAYTHESGMRLQIHQPDQYAQYWGQNNVSDEHRPVTAASVTTYDQAQFGDFDGVHCDPDAEQFVPHLEPELSRSQLEHQAHKEDQHQQTQQPRASALHNTRPTSYFDPSTGQNMMFYPAPVPAMLNLPPKLSKKPKAAVRNARRSQVLSAMPATSRQSRAWLPDPMETSRGSQHTLPLMSELLGPDLGNQTIDLDVPPQAPALALAHARQPSEASTIQPVRPPAEDQREIRRPQRLKDADKRRSRAAMLDGLPPQLRASAFFDLASSMPTIEVKDGSAMATLDSLLDASIAAPVSAFTDHAFAGKLGPEIYGPEKKKKKKSKGAAEPEPAVEEAVTKPKRNVLIKKHSNPNLLDYAAEPKKRASNFSLLPGRRNRDADDDEPSRDEARHSSESSRDGDLRSPNPLAPGADEETSSDEESETDEERDVYQGPPTTLLAELQLRKQQNRMRTRKVTEFTNGMHSTLLELDAVAQVEQKARKGKRVNLAWEDPNANAANMESDDEDVPLGMLAVAKAAGNANANRSTMDISALMSEVNRPLGLMERREMEDNEPLSRRRERLQGRDSGQLPTSLDMMQKRMSHMNLTPTAPGLAHLRSQSRLTLPLQAAGSSRAGSMVGRDRAGDDSEPEHEGETLAARKARLVAENPLPRARPVSGMFSAELLSQFGADDDGAKIKGTHSRGVSQDVGKENAPPNRVPEEEETLGQRRRRLQAEREAREREMASGGPAQRIATPLGLNPNLSGLHPAPLSRPISMADTLGVYPVDTAIGNMNPIEQQRLRREAEAVRVQIEQQARMAAFSAQMPTTLSTTSHGAKTGGYLNGRYNNGMGGQQVGAGMSLGYNGSNISLLQRGQGQMMGVPQGQGYGYEMPMANPGGGVDMVERWRQGVLP